VDSRIGLTALRQDLTHIIDQVKYRGTQYVIVRYDEPAAALVPVDLFERWKHEREEIGAALRDLDAAGDPSTGSRNDRVLSEFLAALATLRDASNDPSE